MGPYAICISVALEFACCKGSCGKLFSYSAQIPQFSVLLTLPGFSEGRALLPATRFDYNGSHWAVSPARLHKGLVENLLPAAIGRGLELSHTFLRVRKRWKA
ncbi:hypothetical protein KIL84_016728 [Mauremys mutica]|uniref:Uncharacterized protein n=1 Tax=Mauremys mutica TaxID=74926 RepID=A0A9D4AWQ7_9SAUR|nr:hypothetical protein KIL84_016728 [Mauremys mutica]